jgi:hypothetical protein
VKRRWRGRSKKSARQQEKFEMLARKKSDITTLPAFESNADTSEMLKQLDARDAHLEKLEREVREWERQNAKGRRGRNERARLLESRMSWRVTHGKKLLRGGSAKRRWEIASGRRRTAQVKIQGPDFPRGRKREEMSR